MNSVIVSRFEHTLPTPFGMREEIDRLCVEARQEEYRAVVVPSSRVAQACTALEGADIKVSCLVGFPFGWSDADAKRYEIEAAIDAGAQEIEYFPSLARLKEKQHREVLREMRDAADACDERPLKIVIEAAFWTADELAEIIQTVLDSGAQFLSTGAIGSLELLSKVRELAGPDFGLKCELPSLELAEAALQSGADLLSVTRLGRLGARLPGFGI